MSPVLGAVLLLAAAAPARADVTDRMSRSVTVPSGTPITVQVTVGDVRVSGWDRPEVSVEIVRRAPDARRLATIAATVEEVDGRLLIRATQQDEGRDALLRADVILRVPASARLGEVAVFEGTVALSDLDGACAVMLERGDISASGVSGLVRLETAIGNIHLDRARLAAGGLIRLRTFNGNVELGLAAVPEHARILALSLGGTIASDIPLTRRERWGPRFGEATLGNGEPVISIDVVNGNVSITVPSGKR